MDLETSGTKEDLLQRLRQHATEEAGKDKQRKLNRATRVRQGVGDVSKERYELVDGNEEDEVEPSIDDDGFFYFSMPEASPGNEEEATKSGTKMEWAKAETPTSNDVEKVSAPKKKKTYQNVAAPPPQVEPNAQGERVVTTYSTSDTNDLTGASAASPGGDKSILMEGEGGPEGDQPWELGAQKNQVPVELQDARDTVEELVRSLLLLGGAPAFREEFTEGLQSLENKKLETTVAPSMEFVGFDPSRVPADILITSSKSLRAGRGSVLQDVLHEVELRSIGHDGMAGDDVEKGGGHYQEVSKVRAFLEGFRRAELRRISRETTTMLLDTVATEGVQGLDSKLSTMTKTQDDSGDAGELSDSLLDFLNDMVREQETRVGESVRSVDQPSEVPAMEEDALDKLWGVETEDGQRVETLDPKDPQVVKALRDEQARLDEADARVQKQPELPSNAPEQLLLLLKLLRDRIKAEAAFGNDDHGRNLRILAYCLRFERAMDREKLLRREFQSSIDVSG